MEKTVITKAVSEDIDSISELYDAVRMLCPTMYMYLRPLKMCIRDRSVIPDRESAGQTRHKGSVKGNLKYVFN